MTDETKTPEAEASSDKKSKQKTHQDFTVRGNVASIDFKKLDEERYAASLSLVVENRYQKDGQWVKGKPSFYPVNITNKAQVKRLMDAFQREENPLRLGAHMQVEGFLNTRKANVNGEDRYFTELVPRAGETAVKTEFGVKENGKADYAHTTSVALAMVLRDDVTIGSTKGKDGKEQEYVRARGWTSRSKQVEKDGQKSWTDEYQDHTLFSDSPAVVAQFKAWKEAGQVGKGALLAVEGAWERTESNGKKYDNVRIRGSAERVTLLEPSKAAQSEQQQEADASAPETSAKGAKKGTKKDEAKADAAGASSKSKKKVRDNDTIPF